MKPTLRLALAMMTFGALLTACDTLKQAVNLTPGPTNNVLFQDDFSDPGSGWSILDDGIKFVNYDQGHFRILVADPGYSYWSTPRLKLKDVRIDVDASKISGPDNNTFGVICRYQDENHFYSLVISSDGYYGITKMKDGAQQILGAQGMQVGDVIQKGTALNHLRADCTGSQLSLWVNSTQLIQVEDSDYSQGDAGLIASSLSDPGVNISFDNFIVAKP